MRGATDKFATAPLLQFKSNSKFFERVKHFQEVFYRDLMATIMSNTTTHMTSLRKKSKKDNFAEQLKELQLDISKLSNSLAAKQAKQTTNGLLHHNTTLESNGKRVL